MTPVARQPLSDSLIPLGVGAPAAHLELPREGLGCSGETIPVVYWIWVLEWPMPPPVVPPHRRAGGPEPAR